MIYIFKPHHTILARYYGFTLCVHVSVHLSYICPSILSFLDNDLSKYQWIFTKLGMCIDNVEIWFGITSGQILWIFYIVICPLQDSGGVL